MWSNIRGLIDATYFEFTCSVFFARFQFDILGLVNICCEEALNSFALLKYRIESLTVINLDKIFFSYLCQQKKI